MSARLVAIAAFGVVGRITLQQVMAGIWHSRAATRQITRSAFLKSLVQPRQLTTFLRWSGSGRSNCKVWRWASTAISIIANIAEERLVAVTDQSGAQGRTAPR